MSGVNETIFLVQHESCESNVDWMKVYVIKIKKMESWWMSVWV